MSGADVTNLDKLTCQELVGLVTDYLEGALSAEDRARFEGHLATCIGCRRHLQHMRTTIQLVGRLSDTDLDPATRDRFLTAFRNWNAATR
jgi:anti-sigma factor RsiW